MATTYVSTKCATGVQVRQHLHDDTSYCSFNIEDDIGTADEGGGGAGGTAFVVNDVVQMVKVDQGMVITDVILKVPALDSSTGIVVAVGDDDDDDRYITASTIGRSSAAGLAYLNNPVGLLYGSYAAANTIDFKVTTVASGVAVTSGTIKLAVRFTTQQ